MKKTVEADLTTHEVPGISDEGIAWREHAEANRKLCEIKDVSRFTLPEDLESRLAHYAYEDPVFADHVKRAHKYYTTLPEARGQDRWRIEVKQMDLESGEFNKFGPSKIETIPTPEELRSENAFGKLRFVIHYWTPQKMVKGMKQRPGIMSIKSKIFEIAPPAQMQYSPAGLQSQPITLPPQNMVDAFQGIFTQAQQMLLAGAALQMDMIGNRQKIVQEGVEIGKLQKQNEVLASQVTELTKLINAFQENAQPPEVGSSGGQNILLQTLIDKFGPMLLEKFGMGGGGVTPQGGNEPQG
jgi:hypothetical protein